MQNKFPLNITRTEVVIFSAKSKFFVTDLKLKISGQKLFLIGVKIDEYLSWATQLCVKFLKFIVMLSKKHYFF